jgi:hypothetical protein
MAAAELQLDECRDTTKAKIERYTQSNGGY